MVQEGNVAEYNRGETIINAVVNNRAVKVDRQEFLGSLFSRADGIQEIIDQGPIGLIDEQKIQSIAVRLVDQTTLKSSALSFASGLPGGFALAATIPVDILQFYGMSAVLAQKLMYLYNYPDMYNDDNLTEEGRRALITFLGVMLGVSGASVAVKSISLSLATKTAKKLPQKALTKTIYYPVIKKTITALGGNITKASFAKSVSKFIPVVGGVISGALTMATLKPMGIRLQKTLHEGSYPTIESDIILTADITNETSPFEKLKEAKKLHELDILSEEEFLHLKNKYLNEL